MSPRPRSTSALRRSSSTDRRRTTRPPAPTADRLAIVTIETPIPESVWLFGFTRRHTDVLVEVHNVLVVHGGNTLGDFEILGPPIGWSSEIASFPDVVEVSRLDVPPDVGRYRVQYRESALIRLVVKMGILLRYPTWARNGLLNVETVDRMSRIRRLIRALRDVNGNVRIVSLRYESLRTRQPNLTRVQREIFQRALASGYFEVPRRITLTRLAAKLSRSKSWVSETLAVVERKIVEAARGLID
jgi:predicted DNA binding protein